MIRIRSIIYRGVREASLIYGKFELGLSFNLSQQEENNLNLVCYN